MKRYPLAIVVVVFFVFFFPLCKVQPSLPRNIKGASDITTFPSIPAQVSSPDSTGYDSLLTLLIDLESKILCSPGSKSPILLFMKASADTANGCFLSAGKGTINRSHPESAWNRGRKMAANYDGKRWVLYLKAWSEGNPIPFGEKISGEVTYSSVLRERLEADTLYQLIQVPVGSVVIK
jgi:hypothetical protein